jgi:DNA-binding transcriptional LysR family regulator
MRRPFESIEFRNLRWTVAASQYRSLRQAAIALNVRQSTLSRRLRDVELEFGVVLFERTNGGTHPTLVGSEFLEAARHIVQEAEALGIRFKSRS